MDDDAKAKAAARKAAKEAKAAAKKAKFLAKQAAGGVKPKGAGAKAAKKVVAKRREAYVNTTPEGERKNAVLDAPMAAGEYAGDDDWGHLGRGRVRRRGAAGRRFQCWSTRESAPPGGCLRVPAPAFPYSAASPAGLLAAGPPRNSPPTYRNGD